jgi:predicted RecB family endonuclease
MKDYTFRFDKPSRVKSARTAKPAAKKAGYDRMIILRAVDEWNNTSGDLNVSLVDELVDCVVKAIDAAALSRREKAK